METTGKDVALRFAEFTTVGGSTRAKLLLTTAGLFNAQYIGPWVYYDASH